MVLAPKLVPLWLWLAAAPLAAQLDLPGKKKPEPPAARGDVVPGKGPERLDLPAGAVPAPATEPAPTAAAVGGAERAVALFEALGRTPRVGRAASELAELLALGSAAHAAAHGRLAGTHAPSVFAAGLVLLAAGPSERAVVAARLTRPLASEAAVPLLDELVARDPQLAAPPFLAGLLDQPDAALRSAAARWLEASLAPETLPALQALFGSTRTSTRGAALELVGRLRDPLAWNLLVSRLGDGNAQLAQRAASLLASIDEAEPALLELAFPSTSAGWDRARAYAVLALAQREDSRGTPLFGLAQVEALLTGLSDARPLVAGAAAVALARVGFRSSAAQCGAWLQRDVPHQLVRAGTGVEFHSDFSSLERPALRALALLSGLALGEDGEAWRRWWVESAQEFRPRHAVLAMPEGAHRRLCVQGSDGHGPWTLLAEGRAEEAARGDVLYLDAAASELLFVFLREAGAFDARHLPSPTAGAPAEVLRVAVDSEEKTFTRAAEGAWFDLLEGELARVRAANAWQRHPGQGLTRLAFWRSEQERWSVLAPPERAREHKRLLLADLRRTAAAGARAAMLAELEALYATEEVAERADLEPLLAVLAGEEAFGPSVERTLALARQAAAARAGDAGTEEDPLGRLVVFTLERHGAAAVPALRPLAPALAADTLSELARDARPEARALAAEALVEHGGGEAEILSLLLDPAPLVVATALSALSAHPREGTRARLTALVRGNVAELRAAALRALVPLGGKDVLDLAQECLGEQDAELARAAVWALAELSDPRCAALLGSLLTRGPSSPLYADARRGLARLGDVGVLEALRLARANGGRAQREGALLLAELGRAEAAPVLLTLLAADPGDERALLELSILAGQDFAREEHPETAAFAWWDLVVHDDALAWFLAGVERAGRATPGRAEFGDGTNRAAATFLVEVLDLSEAHLVERALRELERVLGASFARPSSSEERTALREELRAALARAFPQ